MALIGQHQQTVFSNPQNGQTPMDADTVRGNDNALQAKHNNHDNDATIHVQSGLLANRPAFGTPYAMYMDENQRLYADTGSAWVEIPYARLAAATNAFANNVTVGGTLGVTGATTLGAVTATSVNATLSGNGAGITGLSVPAANVVAGTLSGLFTFASLLTANGLSLASGTGIGYPVPSLSPLGAGAHNLPLALPFLRYELTGNVTLSPTTTGVGRLTFIYLKQNSGGGHTVTWSGFDFGASGAPAQTATGSRGDLYVAVELGAAGVAAFRLIADMTL